MMKRYRAKGSIENKMTRELLSIPESAAKHLLTKMVSAGKLFPVGEKRWRKYVLKKP
jgi:hypothetical protein